MREIGGGDSQKLPGGYVALPGGAAMHVAKLRRYTTDVTRFMRTLPLAEEIAEMEPGSDAWDRRLSELTEGERIAVIETMREVGAISMLMAQDLRESR